MYHYLIRPSNTAVKKSLDIGVMLWKSSIKPMGMGF